MLPTTKPPTHRGVRRSALTRDGARAHQQPPVGGLRVPTTDCDRPAQSSWPTGAAPGPTMRELIRVCVEHYSDEGRFCRRCGVPTCPSFQTAEPMLVARLSEAEGLVPHWLAVRLRPALAEVLSGGGHHG